MLKNLPLISDAQRNPLTPLFLQTKAFAPSRMQDSCTTYTRNHGTLRHDYRAHLATDTRGIVSDFVFDTARPYDSNQADYLLRDEKKVA